MNAGGDAAEQIVRMSLEGVEVAARITGNGAKNLAVLIAAVLKEEQKTHGKARLTNMIKSGHELKVFTVQQKDLKTFAKEEGVEFLEMNDENVITALSLDEQHDFCDTSSHFNIYGTEKISRYLADYMEKKAAYSDQRIRGSAINAYWNRLYEEYLEYKNDDMQ